MDTWDAHCTLRAGSSNKNRACGPDFFRKLRSGGRLVFVCLHPTASYHFEILKEIAERFLFVADGKVTEKRDFGSLMADERMRAYLGPQMMDAAQTTT